MRRNRRLVVLVLGLRRVGWDICRRGRTGLRHATVQGTGNQRVLLCHHLLIALASLRFLRSRPTCRIRILALVVLVVVLVVVAMVEVA